MSKLAMIVLLALPLLAVAADVDFQKTEADWRETRAKRLASPNGWLTLVGLSWLSPGENVFGSDPEAAVPLPKGKAPLHAGKLILENGAVRIVAPADSGVTLDGKPVGERVLRDDTQEETDVLKIGEVSFYVIKRGDKFGVRVKDPNSPVRTEFKGLDYFPADPKWRVAATFKPYDAPRKVEIPTVLGTTETMEAPGLITFSVDGKTYTLEPVVEDPENPSLWFIFKDGTSAKETYGAGRFLYSDMPKDGKVVVDFNQAYNPPCAFTPYATCPLPPKQNWLPVRVEAGEKAFKGGHRAID
ncbi:MAG TPA: DUF1684 domain-containing protein [Candidatus Polarisedimenticolaceae bacterium]|nr:DUF1684 domain-containing protein [Candidatus Polarisedimenticolaceae bacterium]